MQAVWSGFIVGDNTKFVIACNTAQLLIPELQDRLGIRFSSLITATVDEITQRSLQKIGLLASPTTIRAQLYESSLLEHGVAVLKPSNAEQVLIEGCIRHIIAGKKPARMLEPMIDRLQTTGAEAVLLGCSELSVIYHRDHGARFLDPLKIITTSLLKEFTHGITY